MNSVFDRQHLRRTFSRAAKHYAQAASLQAEIEDRLLEQLDFLDGRIPQRILDLGSGPGRATALLKKRWPKSQILAMDLALPMLQQIRTRWFRPIHKICADASHLPLADNTVDLVFSNLCLQWVDDLPDALNELRRVMRPGGLLLFTSFGPDTLLELREAYRNCDLDPPLSPFAPIQAIGAALVECGFHQPVLDRDHIPRSYHDVLSLMHELKTIGATDARTNRQRGLSGRQRLQKVSAAYPRNNAQIIAGWEIITAMAWAPSAGAALRNADGDLMAMPVEQIPIRRRL